MTQEAILNPAEYLSAFTKAAQYLTGLTSNQNPRAEVEKVMSTFFKVDLILFIKHGIDGELSITFCSPEQEATAEGLLTDEVKEAMLDVLDSSFFATLQIPEPDPWLLVLLPIVQAKQTDELVLAGHRTTEQPPREMLEAYLGISGLAGTTLSQIASWNALQKARDALEEKVRVRTAELEGLLYDLDERNKELDCLYGLSKLVEKPGISLEEILEGLVEIIPPAWRYPDIICSRATLGKKEAKTENFRQTEWKQSSDIKVHGKKEGTLEVYYLNLEEMPEADKGPFLQEERNLIDAMAERLGSIIERAWAEEELQRINAELEGYAHTVSHDLKGPLSSIMLGVDLLADSLEGAGTGDVGEMSEIVATISRSAENAHKRIKGLLSLAESGQEPAETSPVDVREVVEEVLQERSHEIKKKGMEVDASPDLGTITGNPVQIQQVFSNLIGNAIRYNDSENPVIRISHLGDDDDGGHRYLVRDNGPGIPEDLIDCVFLPFTRGQGGDTGIGLSIVERIVNVYGGKIEAYNDNGACFEFVLRDYQE